MPLDLITAEILKISSSKRELLVESQIKINKFSRKLERIRNFLV
jgi:hypothetical protein